MYTLKNNLNYSKKTICIFLCLIVLLSIGLKWLTLDLDTLPQADTFGYALRGISHVNGDFSESPRKTLGWSLFLYPFLTIFNHSQFFDLLNSVKMLSFAVSIISIYPMYLLSRRFFNEKYSLIACFLFSVEPHLNHNAGLGLSEPLFILVTILTMYFSLSRNPKFFYVAFLLVGILWWIKFNGIVMLPIISVIFFLTIKDYRKHIPKLILGFCIFLIVVSPMLLQRYEQYGDPLYFSQSDTFYTGKQVAIVAENTKNFSYSAFDYINEYGFVDFSLKFIFSGVFNLLHEIFLLTFPYLIFLVPIGLFFSIRPIDQDKKLVQANWIAILGSIIIFITYFAVVHERRLLFHILPFLILFAVIPIQRLIEYGLSTFSFTKNQRIVSLSLILLIVLLLSLSFSFRYETTDKISNEEQINFSKYVISNYGGKFLDAGGGLRGINYVNYIEPNGDFRTYRTSDNLNSSTYGNLSLISLYAESLDDFISIADEYDLKYIIINNDGDISSYYPFLSHIYDNEKDYPYLEKVFDSNTAGYSKLKIKIFKINYEEFYKND